MTDCLFPFAAQLVPQSRHFHDLRGFHLEIRVKFLRPVERIIDERAGTCVGNEYFCLIFCCVEEIAINGREHGVDDLFEVVVDVGLPFFAIRTDSILRGEGVTLMMSMSRLMRSRSGSSESAIRSSSVKVKVCSLEF